MFKLIKQKCTHIKNREISSKHRGGLHYMWSACGACFSHTVLAVTLVGFVDFITKSYSLTLTMTTQCFFWGAFKVAIPSSPVSSPLHPIAVPGLGCLHQGMLEGEDGGGDSMFKFHASMHPPGIVMVRWGLRTSLDSHLREEMDMKKRPVIMLEGKGLI